MDTYLNLYKLQDRVINLFRHIEGAFYLTGGTCLHRYYLDKRYSDDLDYFFMDPSLYRDFIREVREAFISGGFEIEAVIDSRDFTRFILEKILLIDVVNDRTYRHGKTVIKEDGTKIDNIENILANKLTAITGRDEPKDIYDFFCIAEFFDFDWDEIIAAAQKKCLFDKEELISRIKIFPPELLDSIHTVDRNYLERIKKKLPHAVEALVRGGRNSFYCKGL